MSIAIEHLDFSYRDFAVLRDITVDAAPGRITAVIGPNAAGKSTLLRCAIGALRPQRGRVLIDGMNVQELNPRELAQRLAYVSQRSIVSAAFTVRQVVELGRYALSPSASRIDEALARLDLVGVAGRLYSQLSVGQQQRVMLARAFAQLQSGGHLIMDEPTSAMDLRHVGACVELLSEIARDGCTVLLAMHDISLAAAVADDCWLLSQGRMVARGPAGQVLDAKNLRDVFNVDFQWLAASDGSRRLVAHLPTRSGASTIQRT